MAFLGIDDLYAEKSEINISVPHLIELPAGI
jgi:hypothetical protein